MKNDERAKPIELRETVNTDTDPTASPKTGQVAGEGTTRRALLRKGGKLLVYSAPMVTLFRPTEALAATGVSPGS